MGSLAVPSILEPLRRSTCGLAAAGVAALACSPEIQIPDPLVVRVRASEYQWYVVYPGADGVLGTPDDLEGMRDLHVPERTRVEVELASDDYIYGFRIPDFHVNQIAVPELSFSAAFRAGAEGVHALRGDQMCGFKHESLLGRVIVHSPPQYRAWIRGEGS